MLYIGLMSGTSLDALDAVLVSFADNKAPKLLGFSSYPWQPSERDELLALASGCDNELDRAGHADRWVAMRSAELVKQLLNKLNLQAKEIRAIGSHGQTLRHRPDGIHPFTWQIGDGATLAEMTGIPVINQFRQRDIAAGGQGAPLVPAFHRACFGKPNHNTAALNLGGIANITLLPANGEVFGFDTGPANILMDAWSERHLGKHFDEGGQWAANGTVDEALLAKLLALPYFQMPAPKSTGREQFNLAWLEQHLSGQERPTDVQATLLELTVVTVSDALTRELPAGDLIVCGGGSQNQQLMQRLAQRLDGWNVNISDNIGYPSQAIEAMAFAWLAFCYLHNMTGNIPRVTGATAPRILGCLHPA